MERKKEVILSELEVIEEELESLTLSFNDAMEFIRDEHPINKKIVQLKEEKERLKKELE